MLVILLWRGGRYLFLHQPQLVAQVVVGFQQVLDLGFGHGQFVLHLDVLLHGDGAVGEVRVQALRGRRRVGQWVEVRGAAAQVTPFSTLGKPPVILLFFSLYVPLPEISSAERSEVQL